MPNGSDPLDRIDATLDSRCACGCNQHLDPDGPSGWFATEACQHQWQQQHADRTSTPPTDTEHELVPSPRGRGHTETFSLTQVPPELIELLTGLSIDQLAEPQTPEPPNNWLYRFPYWCPTCGTITQLDRDLADFHCRCGEPPPPGLTFRTHQHPEQHAVDLTVELRYQDQVIHATRRITDQEIQNSWTPEQMIQREWILLQQNLHREGSPPHTGIPTGGHANTANVRT